MPSAANKRTTRRDILINRIKFKEYYFMGMAGCRRSTGFKGQPLVGNDACVNPNLVLILLTSLLAGNESKSIEHTANLGFLLVSTVGRLKAHLLFPAVRDQLRGASLFVEIKAARLGRRTVGDLYEEAARSGVPRPITAISASTRTRMASRPSLRVDLFLRHMPGHRHARNHPDVTSPLRRPASPVNV